MKIKAPFIQLRAEMLKSPAWQGLSLCARRVLDRLAVEHLNHGGKENGKLRVSYEQFEKVGIHKRHLRRALLDLKTRGLVKVDRGRGGKGQFRAPNIYTLTFLPIGGVDATDEWRSFQPDDKALSRSVAYPMREVA
jgi:hypothetical protein